MSPEKAHRLDGIADSITVQDICKDVPSLKSYDLVISALGSPVTVAGGERRPYRNIDLAGNRRLLDAAQVAGVPRFLYVSVHVQPSYSKTAYIRAHEEFVNVLRWSGISYSVIRPTGIFTAFNDFIRLARKGMVTVIGDGRAETNPVHPDDVAKLVVNSIETGPDEISAGGPEIFTRREIAELAFRVLSKTPRVLHLPAEIFRVVAKIAGLTNPRLEELFDFVTAVSTTNCVAPKTGRLRLEDYWRGLVDYTGSK